MSDKPISPPRQRMIDDMTARRLSEATQKDGLPDAARLTTKADPAAGQPGVVARTQANFAYQPTALGEAQRLFDYGELFIRDAGPVEPVPHAGRLYLLGSAAASAASLSMAWVTGRDWKRRPVASKMALSRAGTTGIITTSAIPFGRSFASTGGKISISRSWSGRSEPRATRYWPRFHFPFPGPSS